MAPKEAEKAEKAEEKAKPGEAAVGKEPNEAKKEEKAAEAKKEEKLAEAAKEPEKKEPEKKEPEKAAEAAKEPEKKEEPPKKELLPKKEPEKPKRDKEAEERKRKADKKKKQKDKKKAVKEEEFKKDLNEGKIVKGKGGKIIKGKGTGKGKAAAPKGAAQKKEEIDDDIEVDYVVPDIGEGIEMEKMEEDEAFAAVMERFKYVPEAKKEEDEEDKPKKRSKPKASLLEEAEDSEDEEDGDKGKSSLKKRKITSRMSVAELKTLVRRPDVVEVWDTTSADPRLLVYLKAYRNTVTVPRHWSSKRKYMAGKRGVEKPPFKLPDFIESTGIAKIRQAIMDKHKEQSLKQKNRDKVHPKMGKLDIDYQVLHDAFFKFATKPKLTKHNDCYWEGKEYEAKMLTKRPGQLSAALKVALGMAEGAPPPWLINMQRYGPPPAYPNLKIPGLNAPIPQGAEYGYHAGGWGKPPVDEFGNPLYGDWRQQDAAKETAAAEETNLWGEVDDFDEDDEDDEAEEAEGGKDGSATPMLGTATPLVGSGSATPVVSMEGGVKSISGVSSITSGMDTPGTGSRGKRGGIASVSGVSSASLTPTPQLFQVLEEQKARSSKGVYPSAHTYKMKGGRGTSTPIAGVGSSGTGTPLAGIGTPIGGIGTPHGISTPLGIGTPGVGTGTPGVGTRTPHGIGTGTPIGFGSHSHGVGTGTPHGIGTGTPHGIGTHTPGIGTPIGGIGTPHGGGIATPIGGIATPVGGIATPVGGIATPVGGIATPVGGIATPVGGIATPVGGIATPVGGVATPTGLPGGLAPTPVGGADTPGPVTMSLNPGDVETEGILTADIIRQQLKQHEEAASRAKIAAGQKEVEPRKGPAKEKKRKDKTKFKF